MYEHNANQLIMPDEFFLPFGGSLNPDNRWIVMASLIPWAEVETEYKKRLGTLNEGSKAYSVRLALGSLIIKEKLRLSDEETVLAITENPYLQYFIGLHSFQEKAPFNASSMTHFRKRFDPDFINEINEHIVQKHQESESAKMIPQVMMTAHLRHLIQHLTLNQIRSLKRLIKGSYCSMQLVPHLRLPIQLMWDY